MTLVVVVELYLITKLQNLKAIHNSALLLILTPRVVSNYKITKSESYSQQSQADANQALGCI